MTDYGRELRFGYFLVPNAADPLLATAQQVERLGLDYVAVQDHPYQRRFVDTWTLLAMIAATPAGDEVPGLLASVNDDPPELVVIDACHPAPPSSVATRAHRLASHRALELARACRGQAAARMPAPSHGRRTGTRLKRIGVPGG